MRPGEDDMGDSSSPQLAPGVMGTEGVWTGGGRPLYGLKRQPPLDTPRSERNSNFCGPTASRTYLAEGPDQSHLHDGGWQPNALELQEVGKPPQPAMLVGSDMKLLEPVATSTGGESSDLLSFAGRRFFELGGPLVESLQNFMWDRSSKTLSTASDTIFPLPLGDYPGVPQKQELWLRAVLLGLNSLAGVSGPRTSTPNEAQKRLVSELLRFLSRMCDWEEQVPQTGFSELFDVKGVDYRGEEIKLARAFNWGCIAGALPKEVGTLELSDFCSGGCKHYIDCFEEFLLPPELQVLGHTPRIMVADADWCGVVQGLLSTGICGVYPRHLLHHVDDRPLLNGLFAVSKNEFSDAGIELHRLIMNMVPLNKLCRSIQGDVGTLPTLAGLSAFYLEENEIAVMNSEDIKCFYYLFRVPDSWMKFMGFAREIPTEFVPAQWKGEPCHLVAQVLPMGCINSVGLAQHIHRNVVRWSLANCETDLGGEAELRRDRPAPMGKDLYRVYLDNWDEVRKVDKRFVEEIEGKPSLHQLALRQQYSLLELPRHPKKSVDSSCSAEIQGALLDGREGVAHAKPEKVLKYMGLAWELVCRSKASLRELQVVAGGLVYITMFRRPLLCALNEIWRHMEHLKGFPPVVKLAIPRAVKLELVRFVALLPLAQMDFRVGMYPQVTASDASTTGGGISCSTGLTAYGLAAQGALMRGEFPEPLDTVEVLTVGLFDGIGALRVAADVLQLPVAGHISVECNPHANRVLESAFPGSRTIATVQDVTAEEVRNWACEYSSVGVVLIGAGPPCQGVSGLNADRRGSQRDHRSCLYKEIPRIQQLVQEAMPWAQVHLFTESVASMDETDRTMMSQDLGLLPNRVDAAGLSLARRPRLYWVTWELQEEAGLGIDAYDGLGWNRVRTVHLSAEVDQKAFLEAGWFIPPGNRLATFTTSRPSETPGRRPAGLHTCDQPTLERWHADSHRYPPYQYKEEYCVHHKNQPVRPASVVEREAILGFPVNYTQQCVRKADRSTTWAEDIRKTLLGNSWSVGVVVCLLKQLFERLGLIPKVSLQELVDRMTPGRATHLQMILQRPPLRRENPFVHPDDGLARRLTGLVSIKGEDLLLQGASEAMVKHHRLRASVPSKLWKWKEVGGWCWKSKGEHVGDAGGVNYGQVLGHQAEVAGVQNSAPDGLFSGPSLP